MLEITIRQALATFGTIHVSRGEVGNPEVLQEFASSLLHQFCLESMTKYILGYDHEVWETIESILRSHPDGVLITSSELPQLLAFNWLRGNILNLEALTNENLEKMSPEEGEEVLRKGLDFTASVMKGIRLRLRVPLWGKAA
ncbi:MAG: hypothetical protein AAB545_01045 [Patescibacteria group bacterium]